MISTRTRRGLVARTGFAVSGLVLATALAGCGAGQVSQVATQEPAVNGTLATFGDVALRNIHIQAVETGDALEPGTDVDLVFTAANLSSEHGDRLLDVTTDVGEVSLTGSRELPAQGVLIFGEPDGAKALGTIEGADAGEATIALSKPIHNGLTYDFTFKFERAGEHTVAVPISAGELPDRSGPTDGEGGGHGGH